MTSANHKTVTFNVSLPEFEIGLELPVGWAIMSIEDRYALALREKPDGRNPYIPLKWWIEDGRVKMETLGKFNTTLYDMEGVL